MANYNPNFTHKPNRYPTIPKGKGIYMITDNITGISYIGSSSNVHKRVSAHTSIGNNSHVKGIDMSNCAVKLLEDCKYLNKCQRLALEHEYIIKHNTIFPNGCNKTSPVTNLPFGVEIKPKPVKRTIAPLVVKRKKPSNPYYKNKPYFNVIKF